MAGGARAGSASCVASSGDTRGGGPRRRGESISASSAGRGARAPRVAGWPASCSYSLRGLERGSAAAERRLIMYHRLAVLAFLAMIVIAGAAGRSAQAQVPAPAGFLTVGTLALAQAPADSSSGSQSTTQSTSQSSTPSSDSTVTRHESSTTTTWPVSPLWIVIGVIALVALIALIVASSRRGSGSTTTVVK